MSPYTGVTHGSGSDTPVERELFRGVVPDGGRVSGRVGDAGGVLLQPAVTRPVVGENPPHSEAWALDGGRKVSIESATARTEMATVAAPIRRMIGPLHCDMS